VGVDVADVDSVTSMVEATLSEFGTVDILVNNAALFGEDIEFNPTGWDPLEGSLERYRRAMSVNVDSIVYCSRAVAPIMKAKGWGRIVNQSSAGIYYDIGNLYSLSKLAVVSITRMFRPRLGTIRSYRQRHLTWRDRHRGHMEPVSRQGKRPGVLEPLRRGHPYGAYGHRGGPLRNAAVS
jgi:NADP-dependent 3-hydroxy acid dehydrogenase YdfG